MTVSQVSVIPIIDFPKTGKYIIAVSGGVDSVSLLDILAKESKSRGYQLVVAHFDHGVRVNSSSDRRFVSTLAEKYNLPFEFAQGELGAKATEATARTARYDFLASALKKHKADGIITAHHLDDALETAIFNAARGADGFGLTPMHLTEKIIRPLLNVSRTKIVDYAQKYKLTWQDDPTNQDVNITRNLIRAKVLPLTDRRKFEKAFARLIHTNQQLTKQFDSRFKSVAKLKPNLIELKRIDLVIMDVNELPFFLRFVLKKIDINLETKQLNQLIHFIKVNNRGDRKITDRLRAKLNRGMLSLLKT